jgi:hypothetical protein
MPTGSLTAVEKLEREFAAQLGVAGAVAAGFGRGALWLALEAAGVRGGEVAVPDFVCAQVPEAVRRAGAKPVFYRVARALTISAESLEAALSEHTRAAIVVHYFGRVQENVQLLSEICRKLGIGLIEDCALAMGAQMTEQQAGKFGDLAIFSFTKSDWCYGGGIAVANSSEMLARLREIRAKEFHPVVTLSRRYGLLRSADFVANRPSRSRAASIVGRSIEIEGVSRQVLGVMPVDFQHIPVEGSVFIRERIDVHHLAHPAVNLEIVLVNNAAEIIQLIMPGSHRRFPDAAFLLLSVAHDAVDSIWPA